MIVIGILLSIISMLLFAAVCELAAIYGKIEGEETKGKGAMKHG